MDRVMFSYDRENDIFYLVDFQEKRFMKIAEKGSQYYELCRCFPYLRWYPDQEPVKTIISSFQKVDTLDRFSGREDIK